MNYGITIHNNFEHSAKMIGKRSDSTIICIKQSVLAADLTCGRARASKQKHVALSTLCVCVCVCVCVCTCACACRERETDTHTHTKRSLRTSGFWVCTQCILVVIYRPYLQVSRGPSTTARPLKMGSIGCPETSVNNYQHTLPQNPEDRRPHLHRGKSLKSRER